MSLGYRASSQALFEGACAPENSALAALAARAMTQGAPSWILQGEFGRATVNVTERALVEHAHREFNMLFKLGGADLVFRNGGRELVLNDDAVLIFNPWSSHAKAANAAGPSLVLSLVIEPQWLVRVLAAKVPSQAAVFPKALERISEEVRLRAHRLAVAIASQSAPVRKDCENLLVDLVDAVTREYVDPALEREFSANVKPVDYRIKKALAYIQSHAMENLKSDDLARMVGLSRSRFFEQFRACVGTSPQHYIDWTRLAIATRWLSTSDRPLSELAEELGFSGHSHFTRFFTQHIGVRPAEFRRQIVDTLREAPALQEAGGNIVRLWR